MNSLWVLIWWVVIVVIGYWVYARWAAKHVFEVDPNRATPAKMYMDGVDFMPANKNVLYGFQLNSIAGAAPIIGPIVALQWGWLPTLLWLGLGVFFIGWLQDFSSAMVSIRNDGDTFGALGYKLISPRARKILLTFVYFYLLLIACAFGHVITKGISHNAALPFPLLVVIAVAFLVGHMIYKARVNIIATTILAIVAIFVAIWLGTVWNMSFSYNTILICVLIFGYFSSILPVWRFIQPYNYSSVYVVYFGIIAGVIGIIIGHKPMTLPAFTGWSVKVGPLWPILFVTVACGAISGWHSLVSSTATSRQLENELDVRPVTAGAMFAEFTISIIAVIVCATAFSSKADYLANLKNPVGIFVGGLGGAITSIGLPISYAKALAGMMIIILALTIVNLVFRFMKVATAELLGDAIGIAKNPHLATIVALAITFLLVKTGTWLYIWVLFGGANQLMASFALLLITLFLVQKSKNYKIAIYPMFFMYATTVCALFYTAVFKLIPGGLAGKKVFGNFFAAAVAILLIILALILAYDGWKAFRKFKAGVAEASAEAEKAPA
ncbi:MAG: carbon starvation protein A [Deltaproteobacteria bacterium]|nr:carbon starvation protein A [Deltaproteobacteria bacterium]MBW1928303.1 carbon starvation protein A [Deltaproteobacteria bacterium]MBW2124482.1 carbon starvation protein A [Deltaproteobacteria bacterium]